VSRAVTRESDIASKHDLQEDRGEKSHTICS